MALKISEIVIYPVKSFAGNPVGEAEVVETGFRNDRTWMVVDDEGRFVSQRQHPKMALVRAAGTESGIRLTLPGAAPQEFPVIDEGPALSVEVWEQSCEGVDQGSRAAQLLSDYLGRPCRLVRMRPGSRRRIKPKYYSGDLASLQFADALPFLLISQASLDDLNGRLADPVEMNRFRPNLVVEGGEPFQEDGWKRIRVGEVELRVVKSCVRCEMITIDQSTGIKGVEPQETLGTYRTGPKGILFGQNLLHEGLVTIRVGDAVEVLE